MKNQISSLKSEYQKWSAKHGYSIGPCIRRFIKNTDFPETRKWAQGILYVDSQINNARSDVEYLNSTTGKEDFRTHIDHLNILNKQIAESVSYQTWKKAEKLRIEILSDRTIKHLEMLENRFELIDFIKFLYGKQEFKSINLRKELLLFPDILYAKGRHHIKYRLNTLIKHKLLIKTKPGHYKII